MAKIYGTKRKFNGKAYTWAFTSSVKARAKEKANKLRGQGYSVRMVKQRIGYMVYRRSA